MEFVASNKQLCALRIHHPNLKDYHLGRTIQLVLSSLTRLCCRAPTFGCRSQYFFARLEALHKLIKNQDTAFNKIPNDAMFTVKVSIHQKNAHLWTQQSL